MQYCRRCGEMVHPPVVYVDINTERSIPFEEVNKQLRVPDPPKRDREPSPDPSQKIWSDNIPLFALASALAGGLLMLFLTLAFMAANRTDICGG